MRDAIAKPEASLLSRLAGVSRTGMLVCTVDNWFYCFMGLGGHLRSGRKIHAPAHGSIGQLTKMWGVPLAGKTLLAHLWASLMQVILGFLIAVVIGIPIGLMMGFNPYARAIISPFSTCLDHAPDCLDFLGYLWLGNR